MYKLFINGSAGTTGLRLRERLEQRRDIELISIDDGLRKDAAAVEECMSRADVVFLCLPDDASRQAARLADRAGCRVIDCSSAHRVSPGWVYGFPELGPKRRADIAGASRVSVPGCYACGFVALVRPLVEAGVISPDASVAFHALSGYTGGGKAAIAQYEAARREAELDSPRHYALSLSHKHIPEMTAMSGLTKKPLFSPIICGFPCGMTVAVPLFTDMGASFLRDIYRRFYEGQRFIQIRSENEPESGFIGANGMAGRDSMEIFVSGNSEQAVVMARFDNLGKGASGAAIQCLNIMSGADEASGLAL